MLIVSISVIDNTVHYNSSYLLLFRKNNLESFEILNARLFLL